MMSTWISRSLWFWFLLCCSVNCMQESIVPASNQTIFQVLGNLTSSPYLVSDPRSLVEPLHGNYYSIPGLPTCVVKLSVSVETRGRHSYLYEGSDVGFYTRCVIQLSSRKDKMQTCLYSGTELKKYMQHRPKTERRFEIRYLQGIPSGCPSGKLLLQLHETMATLFGAHVSELEDISAIQLFRVANNSSLMQKDSQNGLNEVPSATQSKRIILTGQSDEPIVKAVVSHVNPQLSVAVRSVILYTLLNATQPVHPHSYYSFFGYQFSFVNQHCKSKFYFATRYIYHISIRQVIAQLNWRPCHDCLVQTDNKRSFQAVNDDSESSVQTAVRVKQLLESYGKKQDSASSVVRYLHRLGQSDLKAREECEFLVNNLFNEDHVKDSAVLVLYDTEDSRYSHSLRRAIKILGQTVDMIKILH